MILSCVKSGRWWSVNSVAHGDWLARTLGLKDYEISEVGK